MIRFLFLLPAIFLCYLAQAGTVYKCTEGGKVSYGDRPCAHGAAQRMPPPAAGVDPPGANGVATGDARTLLETEKLRIRQQETRLKQQDKERAAHERHELAERRERQKLAREAAVRHKTCERLRLRARWANEDAARLHGDKREAARLKARRQAEALAVECPA